jgi:hypothetical protein
MKVSAAVQHVRTAAARQVAQATEAAARSESFRIPDGASQSAETRHRTVTVVGSLGPASLPSIHHDLAAPPPYRDEQRRACSNHYLPPGSAAKGNHRRVIICAVLGIIGDIDVLM